MNTQFDAKARITIWTNALRIAGLELGGGDLAEIIPYELNATEIHNVISLLKMSNKGNYITITDVKTHLDYYPIINQFPKTKAQNFLNFFGIFSTHEVKGNLGYYYTSSMPRRIDTIYKTYYWNGFNNILKNLLHHSRSAAYMGDAALRIIRYDYTKQYQSKLAKIQAEDRKSTRLNSSH